MKYSIITLLVLLCAFSACQNKTNDIEASADEITQKAQDIHENVITLDTHVDISTSNFTTENNYTQNLGTQVSLPKMEEGGLDVAWFVVYTGQGDLTDEGYAAAYKNATDKFDAIHRLAEEIAPERIEIAYTSDDVRRIVDSGKKVAMIGIENGYPVGTDISRVKEFYDRGGRYMSLSHNGHSQLSDSNTGERDDTWRHNGVSELGKEVIAEMNKWGIMIDLSHPSKEANMGTMRLTKAPVIASHSAARAMNDVSRNLSDEELMMIKKNGGVVQTVAFKSYINSEKNSKHREEADKVVEQVAGEMDFEILSWDEVRELNESDREAYMTTYREVQEKAESRMSEESDEGAPAVNVADFVDHIDYMVDLIGLKHVGISSDFDGGGGVEGWMDASETFNVTRELVKRGYTEKEIGMLWSGNLLRVLDEVQAVAKNMQEEES